MVAVLLEVRGGLGVTLGMQQTLTLCPSGLCLPMEPRQMAVGCDHLLWSHHWLHRLATLGLGVTLTPTSGPALPRSPHPMATPRMMRLVGVAVAEAGVVGQPCP